MGVQHIKTYIFDEDIILSGANLSDWYFVNRQDRYILIKNEREISSYFEKLIEEISKISYKFNGNLCIPPISNDLNEHIQSLIAPKIASKKETDTWLFPSVQMGPYNIIQDQIITQYLFGIPNSHLSISSAYFNFPKNYIDILLNSNDCKIITASPEANGFFGSKGFSKHVPTIYSMIEEDFYRQTMKSKVKIFEYKKEKWTFHAKGLWMSFSAQDDPMITMIGSPNFGHRSVNLDLEAQAIILTENQELRKKLKKERDFIFQDSEKVDLNTFDKHYRKPTILMTFLKKFLKNYM